jgi:hypothetical protein
VDHCFLTLGLHRIEVNIRPENRASLRVVEKLGFRPEGLRRRYLHIDGAWRDHLTFALTVEDVPEGLLPRWRVLAADLAHEKIERELARRHAGGSGSGLRPDVVPEADAMGEVGRPGPPTSSDPGRREPVTDDAERSGQHRTR